VCVYIYIYRTYIVNSINKNHHVDVVYGGMGFHGALQVSAPLQLSVQSLSGESGNRSANFPVIGRATLTTEPLGELRLIT